ncbi:hypothetical protein FX988_00715 [Paraglaciecola mesophila]|uniref:OmpA-like domain-containing protein n=1 Tax=Paraglaciecola mesophila TaxID=197222 RepID=A0A857JHR3_9ALTE|nr:hypothetical protein [Paraglaciecola mesophila]QHJ10501.1 hypothetical protein FX988_00715 [Paraglaciecola mesophila]
MDPLTIIIWVCVVVFILTAFLTLLHISGIYQLPDPEHGKVLFKALVVEIVVISVAAFGAYLGGFNQNNTSSDREDSSISLDWENRLEIVDGIEKGCIYFQNDSSLMFPSKLPKIAEENMKLKLETMTFGKLLISGYGDPGHPKSFSAHVGMIRARAVADYLINNGASAEDITTMAYGEFRRNLYVHPFVCGVIVNRQEN